MTEDAAVDSGRAPPSQEELVAEMVRLREELACAGLDADRALAEIAAVREETRQTRDIAADAVAGHAREMETGRIGLAGAEALNEELRRANIALEASRAALAESEHRCHTLVASATDYAIITTNCDGCITSWNQGARNVLGWAESEVLGRDAALIFTPENREAGVPEAEMRTALAQGSAADEHWHLRRDGSRFWAEGRLTPLRNGGRHGFLKILRDHTKSRQAGRERERLVAMLGQSQTLVCDWEGRVEVWSKGMERLFGFTPAEAVGTISWELLRSEFPEPWPDIKAALRREGCWQGEMRHRYKDGSPRIVQATWLVQSGLDGEASSLVVAEEDQTAAKRAEEALQRLNETLEAQVDARTAELRHAVDALHAEALEREQAEAALRQAQKMEAVGQLTGGIAHDFNNMLQGIGGSLEMMQRFIGRGRADEAGQFADAARKTVERAAALTHRLLAFARRQALQSEPVKPDALVEGTAELIRRTVGLGVQVELRIGDGIWTVLCDANQLENALLNLAINARDAMPGGGRLTLSTGNVRLGAADVAGHEEAKPGDYVEVAVADTGTGMTPEVLAHVFEPFFTTKPLGQGTGLGLSQLYGFARQSNGVVRLESVPGRGTTVRLYLPRHADAGEQGATKATSGPADVPPAGAGETVLLVEDEALVREVVAQALGELGYRVLEAGDGPAALRVLHADPRSRLDLLVTDVDLPDGLNGRQVAEIAREARPGLKVLFITGFAGSILEGQLAPDMEVIGKPFTLDALAARVRGMIKGEGSA